MLILDNEREFLVLARELNFVRAADMLHISQPTLTRHIAYLEKELGFKLFNRSPMSLTEAGQTFCTAIGGIIDQLDASVDACRRIAAETSVGLLINIILSSNNKFADIIYEAMTVYRDKNPYTPMPRLYQNHEMSVAETVYAGKADVGIVFTKPSNIPEGFAASPEGCGASFSAARRLSSASRRRKIWFCCTASLWRKWAISPSCRAMRARASSRVIGASDAAAGPLAHSALGQAFPSPWSWPQPWQPWPWRWARASTLSPLRSSSSSIASRCTIFEATMASPLGDRAGPMPETPGRNTLSTVIGSSSQSFSDGGRP